MSRYPTPLRLDIGCGWKKRPGFVGIDFRRLPNVDIIMDVTKETLPFDDGSVSGVVMSHFMEHIQPGETTLRILREIHRVLKEGGTLFIECPSGKSTMAWADPTHVRKMELESFQFLDMRNYWWGHYRQPPFDVERIEDVRGENVYRWYLRKVRRYVDIVMPSWNNHKCLWRATESIRVNTSTRHNTILVDNGCEPPLLGTYEGHGPVTVLPNEENLGWIGGVNQGLSISSAPYVLLCNDDIKIQDGDHQWLDRLIQILEEDPECGAVGPTSNFVLGMQNINPLVKNTEGNPVSVTGLPVLHETNLLIGFCMLLRREVVDQVGGLDERFGLGGNDDLDYSIRIRQAGWKMKIARNVYVHHFGARTTGRQGRDEYVRMDNHTRKILVDKWGQETVDECFVVRGGKVA